MHHRAAFLDLNGTLVLPVTPTTLDELKAIPNALESVARLTRAGFVCPVITVQSRIAKGLFTSDDFRAWFEGFAALARRHGAELQGPYVCPHRYAEPCPCKKPQRQLYDQAITDLGIDVRESVVIGDSPDDIRAATALGVPGCLVRTGWASDPAVLATVASEAALVAPSIREAVDWILLESVAHRER